MYAPAAIRMTRASAPPKIRRRRLDTGGRLASALLQQAPAPVRDRRHFLAQALLLELARPLRRAGSDHESPAQAERDEGGPAWVAPGRRDPARTGGQAGRLLEDGEVAEEGVEVLEQPQAVLEHRQRRARGAQQRAALPEGVDRAAAARVDEPLALEVHRAAQGVRAEGGHAQAVLHLVA